MFYRIRKKILGRQGFKYHTDTKMWYNPHTMTIIEDSVVRKTLLYRLFKGNYDGELNGKHFHHKMFLQYSYKYNIDIFETRVIMIYFPNEMKPLVLIG